MESYLCFYCNMRTTIDLPDELFRHAKALSSFRGISLKTFLTLAVEHELESADLQLRPQRVSFPIVRSRHPGTATITPERIAHILEAEDSGVSPGR